MKTNRTKTTRLWYGVAILVLMLGCLTAAILIITTLSIYPSLIAQAYRDPLQKVEIPGEADLELSRSGAYAVYYEGHTGAYIHAEWPPRLDCRLRSLETGDDIPLVPDYVPTNQYRTKEGQV